MNKKFYNNDNPNGYDTSEVQCEWFAKCRSLTQQHNPQDAVCIAKPEYTQ